MNRRDALKAAAAFSSGRLLSGASDFWNRKPPSDWTPEEVSQLMSRSPWSKEVNADLSADSTPAAGPSYGRGGAPAAPREGAGGAKRRQPVTVRWESARAIREAGGLPLSPAFKDRYAISVSGLPLGVMDRRGQTADPAEMLDQLRAAATLEAKGQAPEQPGVVQPAPRAPGTYLFGFSRELLTLDSDSKEILFTLQTGMVALKARFDPRAMLYRGTLTL
ncbi:MAG: hypothetical protein M3N54_00040 [Acidobacteriota bacterium]|nr:hypothetical protein [Acidobacteriota bacterium]